MHLIVNKEESFKELKPIKDFQVGEIFKDDYGATYLVLGKAGHSHGVLASQMKNHTLVWILSGHPNKGFGSMRDRTFGTSLGLCESATMVFK